MTALTNLTQETQQEQLKKSSSSSIWQKDLMDKNYRFAEYISKSDIIPKAFQGKPANVFIACQMAQRLGIDVMEIMQNLIVVYGDPTFKSSYLIAKANTECFKTPITYEESGRGEDLEVTAIAELKSGQIAKSTVSFKMAKAEGWVDKAGSKYKSMPAHMLRYRAAVFLIRQYCPEVTYGFMATEEVEDKPQRTGITAVAEINKRLTESVESIESAQEVEVTSSLESSLNFKVTNG